MKRRLTFTIQKALWIINYLAFRVWHVVVNCFQKITFLNISFAAGLLMSDFKMTSGDMREL